MPSISDFLTHEFSGEFMNPHPVMTAARKRIRLAQIFIATLVISAFLPMTASSPALATAAPASDSITSDQAPTVDPATAATGSGTVTTAPATVVPEAEPASTDQGPIAKDSAPAATDAAPVPDTIDPEPESVTPAPTPAATDPATNDLAPAEPADLVSPEPVTPPAAPAFVASGSQETEPNDSVDTADILPLGSTINGIAFTDKYPAYSDSDFFAVDLPSAGKVTLDLKFPENTGNYKAYMVSIYNSSGKLVHLIDVPDSAHSGAWLAAQGIFLPGGRSHIRILGEFSDVTWGQPYALTVTHTPGNFEAELNGTIATANPIKLGTTYSGSALVHTGYSYDDSDFFKVDLPSAGKVSLNLKFPANLGSPDEYELYADAYEVSVYDSLGEEVYYFDVPASADSGAWLAAQAMYLPKGKIYVEIYGRRVVPTWGHTYTLSVNHTPGTVETEINDSDETANPIALGTAYSGSALSNMEDDYDVFAVTMPEAGQVFVNLKFPALLDPGDAYLVSIYDALGNFLDGYELTTSEHSGTWLASQPINLPKGKAYIEVYAHDKLPTWGKTYTLTVTGGTVSASVPKITGTTKVGSTLTSANGTWGPAPVTFKYQWQRNGKDIAGATGATYKLVTADAGTKTTVKVTGSKTGFKSATKTSAAVAVPLLTLSAAPVPTISGTLKTDSTLTAKPGTWSPAPVTLKYQWQRNGKDIAGAAKTTYKLVKADEGTKITVKVTGSKANYQTVSKTSAAKQIPPLPLKTTPTPTISGMSKVGSTLTAKAGTWAPAPVTLKYQWLRNGKAITGATKTTYKLVAADGGTKTTVRVTGSKAGYKTVAKTSAARSIPFLALKTTPVPKITGTSKIGSTLTAKAGTWAPAKVTLKYQWLRNGKAIAGATKTTYKLTTADAGTKTTVRVTGSKTGYKTVAKTSAARSIPYLTLTSTPVPTISGTSKVGSTLTAKAGTWKPAAVTLKYQWLRNGKAITGATKTTYKLVAADGGTKVTVRVTGSKAGYKTVAKTSAARSIPKAVAAPKPPAQKYYANCTAARNAGAAPVYRGDPGYGSHLDRDGDGVGCE